MKRARGDGGVAVKGNVTKRNPLIIPSLLGAIIASAIFTVIGIGSGIIVLFIIFQVLFVILLPSTIFYGLYWFYKTKEEINSMGGSIPTFILLFIPIVSIYWYYKYGSEFARVVKKSSDTTLWGIIVILLGFFCSYFVQRELNKYAN